MKGIYCPELQNSNSFHPKTSYLATWGGLITDLLYPGLCFNLFACFSKSSFPLLKIQYCLI
jgi:hypothetical protein